MKDSFNNIDELLKESLQAYKREPSASVWKSISIRLFIAGAGKYILLVVFLAAILTGALIYNNYKGVEEAENNFTNNKIEEIYPSEEVNDQLDDKVNYSVQKSDDHKQEPEAKLNNNKKDNSEIIITQKSNSSTLAGSVSAQVSNESAFIGTHNFNNAANLPEPQKNHFDIYPGLDRLNELKNLNQILLTYYSFNDILTNGNPSFYLSSRSDFRFMSSLPHDDYGKKGTWTYALHITPEIIFVNDPDNYQDKSKENSISLELTGIYNRNDWFIQAGAGIAISEDDGKYHIDYAQYDSIGYFNKVISFEIDPESGKPVFQTTVEGVYDTVEYNTTASTKNTYTYFRLPIFAGYNVYNYKRIGISIKGGGVYSILMKSKEPGAEFNNEKATWIKITNETPGRIQSNFTLSVAIGFSYRLNNNLCLSAEPVYSYYLKPEYEKMNNSKSPYSFGLRTGIIVKF